MCMGTLAVCMSVHHILDWCLRRLKDGVGSLGTRDTDSRELPIVGAWNGTWGIFQSRAQT